jgi:hypothetical protein
MKNPINVSLAGLALGAVLAASLACPGPKDDGPSDATKLAYTNPTSGDYRLEVTGGAGTNAVTLALHGPSSVMARGMNFGLSLDTVKVRFAEQEGRNFAKPGPVFDLGNAPRIFKAVLDGSNMRVSMAQKGNDVPAKALGGDIATVTVQLQQGIQKGDVTLRALDAKVLMADGSVVPVQVQVGKLEAQ